ncbi:hypothetical protein FKW77_001362 [Venturia effusa]|uniref:Cyanovirin-N domain-containing protein n=1 Tax=Venturia effusa TaxID=50376 RepID=A0A517LM80_9PEZI|nr:hypothetical protein FKW77_001362 [Venturia effusa]
MKSSILTSVIALLPAATAEWHPGKKCVESEARRDNAIGEAGCVKAGIYNWAVVTNTQWYCDLQCRLQSNIPNKELHVYKTRDTYVDWDTHLCLCVNFDAKDMIRR